MESKKYDSLRPWQSQNVWYTYIVTGSIAQAVRKIAEYRAVKADTATK